MKPKLTISSAILSIIVLAGGLMFALVSLSLYSHKARDGMQKEVAAIESVYIHLDEIELEFLMAQRAEKDFLLRRDAEDASRHAETMTRIKTAFKATVQEIPAIPALAGSGRKLEIVGKAIDAYERAFAALVASNTQLGLDENSGLEGALRTAVKSVESTLKVLDQPVMEAKMLMMRRHEKDFIMRRTPKYLERLNARVDEFRNFPASMYRDSAQQKEILGLMEVYQTSFASYVDEALREQELRGAVSKQYAEAEPVLQELHKRVLAELEDVMHKSEAVGAAAQTNSLRAGIGGAVVFIALALLLARSISRPLQRTDIVLKKMMQSDFSPEIPKSSIREISAIATAVASFREAEEAKHSLTSEISTVITACGEGDFSRRIAASGKDSQFGALGEGVNTIGEVAERGLGDVLDVVGALAKGDLTRRMPEGHKGIFKDISDGIDNLAGSLEGIIRQLSGSSELLSNTATEISSAVADASRRGESSAAALEETSAALQTVSDTVRDTASSAQDAREYVNDAHQKAENTRVVAEQTVSAMQRIKESSDAISKITGLIDDVAFQTNLLALNAGVEAARAGEAGRGFAVVASEVRALAQRSSDAAKEISTLINSSQTEVTSGVQLVDEAGESLAAILETISHAVEKVNEIAENSVEQANGISEVNVTLDSLDKDSQHSAAMLEETAASGQMLREEAGRLAQAIGGFQISGGKHTGTARPAAIHTQPRGDWAA